ncbi:pyrroline-5-carboxylate reductase [Pelagibacteraceae bacterium]|nr:pyrroline-5-carboxylate reductase [Pelagibacteraceae bacterium]
MINLKKQKFLIIGAGNMGYAVLNSLIENKISSKNILIIERKITPKLKKLKSKYNLKIVKNVRLLKYKFVPSISLISVKPNQLNAAVDSSLEKFLSNSLIVSIVAGKKISDLKKIFTLNNGIVRAMTNTPASVNMGTTLICFDKTIKSDQKKIVRNFLSLLGQINETKNEKVIDDFTAIFGSGPAYIFLFIETLIKIADKSGFKNSKNMVLQTFLGSLLLLLNEKDSPTNLKKSVTSKAGTTEAALKILENKNGLSTLISKAIDKAKKRSRELSKAN